MASLKTTSARQPAELRVAKDRALDVFESLRKQEAGSSLSMAESMLFLDLALLTVEAIECYNNYTSLRPSSIINNARYAKCGGQSQIVKLGYSLSVVLNTLLNERKSASETIRSLTKQLAVYKAAEQLANEQESASAEPPPALERSNVILFDDAREIKEEPAEEWMEDDQQLPGPSGAVKEEEMDLMEVKEEPLDDVVDVKKEMKEEPLADVYCPTTGTARPHEHADFNNFNNQQVLEKGQEIRMTGMRLQLSGQEKVVIVRNSSGSIVERLPALDSAGPSVKTFRLDDLPNSNKNIGEQHFDQKYIGRSRPCYLCGNFTDKYESLPPAGHKTKRADFLDRIILSSPTYVDRVQALRNSHITVYFCPSHISAPTKVARLQFAKIATLKQNCALCGESRSPLTSSPSNPITRRRFFNTLINLSAAEKKKADYFVAKNDVEVSICAKHFAKKHDMYASKDDKKRERQAYHSALKAGIIPSSILRPDTVGQKRAQPISPIAPLGGDSGNPTAIPKEEPDLSGTHYP